MSEPERITQMLLASRNGDREAFDQVYARVYEDLRALAHKQLARRSPGETLSTTVLIHEAYLRMVDQTAADWKDRAHFFAYAAHAMRSILVDYARRRTARKRGGGLAHASIQEGDAAVETQTQLLLEIDQALSRLSQVDERLCKVVECRFFGGLTERETAEALGVTERTIRRDWIKGRAWLHIELGDPPLSAPSV